MDVNLNVNGKLTALQVMQDAPVIPVIVLHDAVQAVALARALVAGGIRMLEVTLRTTQALACIEAIARDVPEAVVGAGTVLTEQQAQAAKAAGAQFFVSPGSTQALLAAVEKTGVPILPGAATPSEMLLLAERGYTVQKFFPAEAAGGVPMLKSLAAVLAHIRFCPTGGLTPENANSYLALPNVVCIGGSWMVSKKLVDGKQWDEIERLSRLAAALKSG